MKHLFALLLFVLVLLPADHLPMTADVKVSSHTRMVTISDWQIAKESSSPVPTRTSGI